MCACAWDFICARCRGTQLDDQLLEERGPSEAERDRRERLISVPDFMLPWGER